MIYKTSIITAQQQRFKYSVPVSDIERTINYCHKHVSPRKYRLHGNNAGGEDWCIAYCDKDKKWKLFVHDDKILTWMALKDKVR